MNYDHKKIEKKWPSSAKLRTGKQKEYNHLKIEPKWQTFWEKQKTYQTLPSVKAKAKKMKPYYVLDMFPYPSGAGLHVGHPRGYIASDAFSRYKRMQGYNVLHPMGFDSFGLPAEQYAIQTGKHPGPFTDTLINRYREQLSVIGFSYDWSREVATHHPEYYKFTQWIFLQIYNSYYNLKTDKAESIEKLVKEFAKNGNTKVSAVCDGDTPQFSAKEWKSFSEIEKQNILMKYRLAYEGNASVNWCEELGTVLANDEIVDGPNGPVSERGGHPVVKKQMRQWFMRITAYADRLIAGLDTINWSSHIKEIQKNWIGRSEGSEIEFKLVASRQELDAVKIFTTRADTLFGATYMVLAPEHESVTNIKSQITNISEVEAYIKSVKNTEEADRTDAKKEKTGVELKGISAINPANGEEIPVWIADYVLAGYGTGAVMAVPAHDERDFDFAKKYNLPIKQVVMPDLFDHTNPPQKGKKDTKRNTVHIILRNIEKKEVLVEFLKGEKWKGLEPRNFIIGGIEEGESEMDAAIREIREETGYINIKFIEKIPLESQATFFAAHKDVNRVIHVHTLVFDLVSDEKVDIEEDEFFHKDSHEIKWIPYEKVAETITIPDDKIAWKYFYTDGFAYTDDGIMTNSGKFDGMTSDEARAKITEFVGGKIVTKYKMRDAIFARQRYWGEPIPLQYINSPLKIFFLKDSLKKGWEKAFAKYSSNIISKEGWDVSIYVKESDLKKFIILAQKFLNDGPWYFDISGNQQFVCFKTKIFDITKPKENEQAKIFARKIGVLEQQLDWVVGVSQEKVISEVEKLPLKLPNVKSYTPSGTGESPLAGVKEWVKAGYETNTMPGWAGSSWYFFRYIDPKNKKDFASAKELDYWFGKDGGVDMYVGGSEHATGHLLYSRFWHKILKDLGYIKTEEPFKTLRNQGLIMAEDGRKMSKRWGNVVNPDDVVKTYGADTLRLYEMFIGPFDQSVAWSTDAIIGPRKFLERVWRLAEKIKTQNVKLSDKVVEKTIHRTIKKVTEDIEAMNFNTAVSSMMICLNEMEKSQSIAIVDFKMFLKVLAPFAPYMAEEIWKDFGEKKTIHLDSWPKYDSRKIIDNEVTIGIQVGGKVRAEITIAANADEESVKSQALAHEKILPWIAGKEIRKVIYVKGRLVNIVI